MNRIPNASVISFVSRVGLSLLLATVVGGVACAGTPASPGPTGTSPANQQGSPSSATVASSGGAAVQPIRIIAAENFYGDVAGQIGGDRVSVLSVLSDPKTDPHTYESSADDAKAIANAQIVIKNGLGYDAFIDRLMNASPRPNRVVVDVGELTGHKEGDNPHVWYDPTTMPRVAQQLATVMTQIDPAGRDYFETRLQTFNSSLKAVDDEVMNIKTKYKGANVLPTEPIFDYMAEALELNVVDKDGAFQRAVESGNDPPAAAVAEFRGQISSHTIKVLIYNSQAVTPITTQMLDLARQNNVAVVAVTETKPTDKTFQQWMLEELKSLQQALGG